MRSPGEKYIYQGILVSTIITSSVPRQRSVNSLRNFDYHDNITIFRLLLVTQHATQQLVAQIVLSKLAKIEPYIYCLSMFGSDSLVLFLPKVPNLCVKNPFWEKFSEGHS